MLWLFRVRSALGDFYTRMNEHSSDRAGSHIVLLEGTEGVRVPRSRRRRLGLRNDD